MSSNNSGAANIVGVHYRVGKKIGEGSFGVIFEGWCFFLLDFR
jgi:casein kinase 1